MNYARRLYIELIVAGFAVGLFVRTLFGWLFR